MRQRGPLAGAARALPIVSRRGCRPLRRVTVRRRVLPGRSRRRPAAAVRRERRRGRRGGGHRAPGDSACLRSRADADRGARRVGGHHDADSIERAESSDAGREGALLGVPGQRLPRPPHGPARNRPPAHHDRVRPCRSHGRVHATGPTAAECVALSRGRRAARAAASVRQHRHRGAPMTSAAVTGNMRVTFLSVSSEMGGSEVSLLELLRGLGRLVPSLRLDVLGPREGPLAWLARACGAAVHVLPLPSRLARLGETPGRGAAVMFGRGASLVLAAASVGSYSRRLARLLANLAPDVIHTNGFKLHVLGARVASPSAAVVWHIHEYVARRRISRVLLRRYSSRCAWIVANSRSVAADVQSVLGEAAPVTKIYNAVDAREFSPDGDALDLDALAGLPAAEPGTVRVGLVATYARWKGHATFLEAIRRISPSIGCRAYIVAGALYDTLRTHHPSPAL